MVRGREKEKERERERERKRRERESHLTPSTVLSCSENPGQEAHH
jgi:hypothetical protein